MTDDSYLFEKPKKKLFSRLMSIAFITFCVVTVFFVVLSNMGGSGDALKASVEDFTGKFFGGRPAHVGKLNRMSFFPLVGVDAENIVISSDEEKMLRLAELKKLQIFMSFWNVAGSTPKFTKLYVEGFSAVKGFLSPQAVTIDKVFVDHDAEAKSAILRGNGTIGNQSWFVTAEVDIFGHTGDYSYMLKQPYPLTAQIGDMKFDGLIVNHEAEYFKIEDFTLTEGNKSLSGDVVFTATGKQLLKVRSDLVSSTGEKIEHDIIVDFTKNPPQIIGEDPSKPLVFEDVLRDDAALYFVNRVQKIWWGDAAKMETKP